ncbi:MAG: RES family NAD+ phosphorylase [Terrimicrobiaceae bacterium]
MSRRIHLPPTDLPERKIRVQHRAAQTWWKVHPASRPPTQFSMNPAHRFSPPDGGFEVLYLASDIETCLWEVFGDEVFAGSRTLSYAAWSSRAVSSVEVPGCRLCNLNSAKTRSAMGCDMTALTHSDVAIPQAWAKAVQSLPAAFEGLLYQSRFTQKTCLALFSPPFTPSLLSPTACLPLNEQSEAVRFLTHNTLALI